MNIKLKISITMLVFTTATFGVLYFFIDKISMKSYLGLERIEAIKETSKIDGFFEEKLEWLNGIVRDWAYWDEAYQYIENKNERFEKVNLTADTMKNLKLNFMMYLDKDYNPVFVKSYNMEKDVEEVFPEEILKNINKRNRNKGFLELADGRVALFAISPVYDLDYKKTNGYFAAGYVMTENIKKTMSEKINMKLDIVGGINGIDENIEIFYKDEKHLSCKWSNVDILKGNSILFAIEMPRNTYNLGKKVLDNIYFIIIIIYLFLIALIFIIMRIAIWDRLDILTDGVRKITFDSRKRVKPLELRGNDELTLLKDSINDMVETIEDMTEKITKDEERYRALYEETAAIHILVDEYGLIKDTNRVILNLIGMNRDDFVGNNIRSMILFEDSDKIMNLISDIILGDSGKSVETRFKKVDGGVVTILLYSTSLLISEEDNTYSILLAGTDITERKEIEKKLTEFASTDAMTEIYNRRMGMELLEKYMSIAERTSQPLTICFVDVNNLKKVNDVYGHNAGDELIKDTAKLLKKGIRDYDILCRMGGDEFLLIFPNCNRFYAQEVWKRIENGFEHVNNSTKRQNAISVSHGFAEYEMGMRIEYFIEMADNEMYEEKKRKKGLK